jgi:putative acetyltransferase
MTEVRVRPEAPADRPAIRSVVLEAFRADDHPEPPEADLIDALRDSDAWLPELSMVAERDGEVVAHALLSRVTVGPDARPALSLGPVAVRPAHQNEGLGTAVVRAALDTARAAGETLVVVLGEPAYYGRFGFTAADRYGLTAPWSGSPYWQALAWAEVEPGEVAYPQPWHDL